MRQLLNFLGRGARSDGRGVSVGANVACLAFAGSAPVELGPGYEYEAALLSPETLADISTNELRRALLSGTYSAFAADRRTACVHRRLRARRQLILEEPPRCGKHLSIVRDAGGGQSARSRSFAGAKDRARVNRTFLQPFCAYTLPSAWTFNANLEITGDWQGDEWSVPLNLGASKVFQIGRLPLSLGALGKVWLAKADADPDWGLRLVATFMLPAPGAHAHAHVGSPPHAVEDGEDRDEL